MVETLDTQLNEPTNQIQRKFQNLLSQLRKRYYKTMGTSVISSTLSSPSNQLHFSLKGNHTLIYQKLYISTNSRISQIDSFSFIVL